VRITLSEEKHCLDVSQAVNDEGGDVNVAVDHDHDFAQPETDTIPGVAKRFKSRGQPWALVVDDNYGEGSAREHAALQPRFYGANSPSGTYQLLIVVQGVQ
jgi:aconitase A